MTSKLKDTILLVGSNNSDRARLHEIFDGRYYLLEAENIAQGIMLLEQNSDCIAAVVADIPLEDGSALRSLVDACLPGTAAEIPVIALVEFTGSGQGEELAFLVGAADVVRKPYATLSIQRRVQLLTELYAHKLHLEKLVEEQNETIRNANQTVLDTLSAIIEHRNTESGNHVLRIRRFTQQLLLEVAACCPEYGLQPGDIDRISSAAVLHDIGKISIPDAILNKPGKLTAEEYELIKTHTTVGSQLVEQLEGLGDMLFLRYSYNICLYHHERWDGRGYPAGLKGDEIPICAQVVGLTDAFDALTTQRVYKDALEYETAINMILNGECGSFSPKLLECFKRVQQEIISVARQYADGYSPKSDPIRVPLPGPDQTELPLDSMQLSHLKYQSLLHHLGDTLIELDVDNKVYHVVYNPNPDFVAMLSNASFDEIALRLMHGGIHPEDATSIDQMQSMFSDILFRQNQRKCTFRCRIYSPPHDDYHPYEVTLMRVNTRSTQRIVLAAFHNLKSSAQPVSAVPGGHDDRTTLFDLTGATLCCKEDAEQTILNGINSLLPLTGYALPEITGDFGSSLRNLVLPEDRCILDAMLRGSTDNSRKAECLYRMQHRSGRSLWVLDRCRIHIAKDGTEQRFHVLTDVTAYKQAQDKVEAAYARNQVVINQTEGIIFEWDLLSDTLVCSEKLRERFGYNTVTADFSRQMRNGFLFHPDDFPLLQTKHQDLLRQGHTAHTDARIVTKEGRYLWSRIRATSVFDSQGTPTYIIGIIHDINELKSDALALKKQAERDGLTKLLNKASTQQAVTEYLESRTADAMGALLVLDMDNFKAVNDTHGHLYGDAVLTQVGATLQGLFRAHDVIGRIGGDEFLIFLKNVPSREMVQERCQLLLDTCRNLLSGLMPDLPVSVSIGSAMCPAHGTGYSELFRRADLALYSAKRKGKNQHAIYNPQAAYETMADAAVHTRIDSDELPVMNDDSLLRFVFRQLYESLDIDATIQELLAFIGTRFNVSRVYIFENNDDNTCCSNTFEWCNVGISPEKDNLQNISYITDIPGWPSVYDEHGVLYCSDISELDPMARRVVEPQGIKSMLHCAIMDRGVFRGYVGFDECTSNRLWTQGQVSTLEILAKVLAVFLTKQRTMDKLTGLRD